MSAKHQNSESVHDCASRLALRPSEAARALGIGERKLWAMTNAGELPYLRIGRAVIYPVRELQEWLKDQAERRPK